MKVEKDYYKMGGKFFVATKTERKVGTDRFNIEYSSKEITENEYNKYLIEKYNPQFSLHHVALKSTSIKDSVEFYVDKFNANILHVDSTWALIDVCGAKISFVLEEQHPPHICFEIDGNTKDLLFKDVEFKTHRDGTKYYYQSDLDGNTIEFLLCNTE